MCKEKDYRCAPVALFVYNRPEHTELTLKCLSEADLANKTTLFIFADGLKNKATEEDKAKVGAVRKILRKKQWSKEVVIVERDENLGLADSIISGVTEVVNRYERVIVLEDDIAVMKGFLRYCNDALTMYEHDQEVMHVSASMYNTNSAVQEETFFLKVLSCHGWATWKRAWRCYNNDAIDHLAYFQTDPYRAYAFDVEGGAHFMRQLQMNVSGRIKTWAVRWYASWLREGGISLFPNRSLLLNTGFDGSGVNCGKENPYHAESVNSLAVSRIPIEENTQVRTEIREFWIEYLGKNITKSASYGFLFEKKKVVSSLLIKFTRKILLRLIPEFNELLGSNGKMSWSNVVTAINGSDVAKTARLYDPVRISYSSVGERTYISCNANISYTEIGSFCSIGPNFKCGWGIHPINGISTSPTFYSAKPANEYSLCAKGKAVERKKITIGNDVFIGMNVTVIDGVSIGDSAIIGAGCVVSKDVPPYAVAVGCPMKIIKNRISSEQREKMMGIEWWSWPEEKIIDVEKMFFKVNEFIDKYGR